MDQNNYTPENNAPETREPLPTWNSPENFQAQPFSPEAAPQAQSSAELEDLVGSAFGKSLASVIIAGFPISSIIAIILSCSGQSKLKAAQELAARMGVSAGGKAVAAKVLGIIGKIAGIVCTAIYGLYFLTILAVIINAL